MPVSENRTAAPVVVTLYWCFFNIRALSELVAVWERSGVTLCRAFNLVLLHLWGVGGHLQWEGFVMWFVLLKM